MILCRRHRFALLAPWKTASSTCHLRLQQYNESPYSRFYDYNPYLQRVVHQHLTYAEFSILPESREGHFTGTFVRNPYDRVYSGFLQLQRDIDEQPRASFPSKWVKSLVMQQLADNYTQLAASEFEFNKWFSLIEEHQIYEVGRNSSFPLHPAHYWTGINRVQNVDFVGKVEYFERDFEAFCRAAGVIPSAGRMSANLSGPISATSAKIPRYLKHMSAAAISKINTLFSADFELFQYEKY